MLVQGIMQRRAYERIPASVILRFYCGDTVCLGKLKNCSENGMCISTKNDFLPCSNTLDLLIPLSYGLSRLTAKICRIKKVSDFNYDIGVNILNPSPDYCNFIANLRQYYAVLDEVSFKRLARAIFKDNDIEG